METIITVPNLQPYQIQNNMTTEEKDQLAQLRAELKNCPPGAAEQIMGKEKLETLLQLCIKETATA